MNRFLACLLFILAKLPVTHAANTLDPDQLKAGMKGYGLSVFKGTKPERFEVEILGVLKNTFPKQDMILVRMSGAELEKHKTIAGMSGSPIYIDGKLIGALAYSWAFENDPIAGVTPIHNMLAELDKPPAQTPATTSASAVGLPAYGPVASPASPAFAPRPLLTPLSLAGFSPRMVEVISEKFQQIGLLPVSAGGGARDTRAQFGQSRPSIEPGSAIGVELIRGDLNAVAVGTACYVEKNKIIAFGHPFFQGGRVEAPAVLAEVHTIMSSMARSFKLASGVAEVGAMVGDWQSCIVADTKVKANMIPVTVEVTNRDTGHNERYAMEVINNQAFSPLLVQIAIAEAIFATSGSSQDTTARIVLAAELADRTVRVSNVYFNSMGGLIDPWALAPLVDVFNTPFGHPEVKRIDVNVDAALTRQTAVIKRVYFSKSEVERGERVPLSVVLKPFGRPEVVKTIWVEVPAATDTMRQLNVAVLAGSSAPPDTAPPDSMNDFLDAIQKRHRSTDLVALVQTPSLGLQYRGKMLKRLPLSVVNVLEDFTAADIASAADVLQIVEPTDWVLSGQATVRVPIRQE
jgi:hypothetical protein